MAISNVRLVKPSAVKATTYWKKTTSTAFNYRTLVTADEDETATAGLFAAAAANTERVLGALQAEVTATQADYASATRLPVLSDPLGEWEMPVGTGTADANDAGGYVDLKDTDELDVNASTIDAFFVSRFISATKLRGYIVRWHFNEAPATN